MEPSMKPRFPLFAHRPLRTRILIIFIILITLPLTIQGYVTYRDFSEAMERKTARYATQVADQINKHLDTTFDEMERISLLPLQDPEVIALLKQYEDDEMQPGLRELEFMSSYIYGILFNRLEIQSLQIITNGGLIFTSMEPAVTRLPEDFRSKPWYARTIAEDGLHVLLSQHTPDYGIAHARDTVISYARLLREPYTNKPLGIIKIDLSLGLFDLILSNVSTEQYGKYIVIDRNRELFFENGASPAYDSIPPEHFHNLTATEQLTTDGERYFTFAVESPETGLSVISLIPQSEILKESTKLRDFTWGIGFLCLAAACALALYFSDRISRPLRELKRKMYRVQLGQFDQSLLVTKDEIGQLGYSFNRMVEEIQRLVNEVYVVGLREKEAELAALISRMNPHFIYNTLESINMMAIRGGNRDVSDMVTALGTLLRHSIDNYDRMIPLEAELESIRSYIQIQQLRYGSRIRVVYDIDEELVGVYIPKLILQPLVENAIYHGIGDGEGTIWIAVAAVDRLLLLIVRDDGAGLQNERLRELRARLSAPISIEIEPDKGIALANIAQRIRLLYGDQAELEIDGALGKGTSVTITIPFNRKEGMS